MGKIIIEVQPQNSIALTGKRASVLVVVLALGVFAPALQASYICPLEIFTDNGNYNDSTDVNLGVELLEVGLNLLDFKFYNDSLIECSIAAVYFDDGDLLGIAGVTSSPGVSFSQLAKPKNLPSGNTLEPPFVTTVQFSIDSDPPVSKNGVNPGEWLRITFDINGGTFAAVIDGLNTGTLRIGTHVIALPDGSSESAINHVPEPTTMALLGLGSLALLRRRK